MPKRTLKIATNMTQIPFTTKNVLEALPGTPRVHAPMAKSREPNVSTKRSTVFAASMWCQYVRPKAMRIQMPRNDGQNNKKRDFWVSFTGLILMK
jgi:hypothetical protein